jgi:hypothetical protein
MKIRTDSITDAALDWAVLEALKPTLKDPSQAYIGTFGPLFGKGYRYPAWKSRKYSPSTDWAQGGPIIEREKMQLTYSDGADWGAYIWTGQNFAGWGPTPLVAAMRCYVASQLGDEVDIPEELK